MASTSLQVAGLASGFDWKSFLDQVMEVERAPVTRLASEKSSNSQKSALLSTLGTRLSALQGAAEALRTSGVFGRRLATPATSNSGWSVSAGSETPVGSYRIAVSNVATAARLMARAGVAAPLAATAEEFTNLTLATLPISQSVTAGTFTVNGQKIAVALTDSPQDVLDAISEATSGVVNGFYDPTADKLTIMSSSGAVALGAANDTSNFLSAFGLTNNGTPSVTSEARLGALKKTAALANANLSEVIGADAEGNGTFSINGVSVAYNVNTDTLAAVLRRINDAGAGVSASYDTRDNRVVLTNAVTGDLGIDVRDTSGGLLAALGLTNGSTFTRGEYAEFTVNGGETLRSASNTLDENVHGIAGLSVTANSEEPQTITVALDVVSMRAKVEAFVTAFNEVQQFIDTNSRITADAKGKVSTAALASNREIQDWARSLRNRAFGAVAGLSGSVDRIDDLGLGFSSSNNELRTHDAAKLDAALNTSPSAVAEFFERAGTGFSAQLEQFIKAIGVQNAEQQKRLNAANNSLDEQIAAMERRLEQQRELMEAAFLQMERAQSTIKQQQSAIDSMFGAKK